MENSVLNNQLESLRKIIKESGGVAVAFSGGLDSSVIAKTAFEELGDRAIAVTVDSDTFSARELEFSRKIAEEIGIKHVVVKHSELENPVFRANPPSRCYHCKKEEMDEVEKIAKQHGITRIAFGVTASDHLEHRPGISALKERDFFLPLEEAGIEKSVMPRLARLLGLSNWQMPSTTCLASRIPYGQSISGEKLNQVEKSEDLLARLGFYQSRVRHHDQIARIEVSPGEIPLIMEHRLLIIKELKSLGFKYISLDLEGYRSGSMDEVLGGGS